MGVAYTPGLKVTEHGVIRKERRLPLSGTVRVKKGDRVGSQDVVAETSLPGKVYALNIAGQLNVLEADLPTMMKLCEGDAVARGTLVAETPGFFGMFRSRFESPAAGTIEAISDKTGRVMLREAPTPVAVRAYVDGVVTEVHEGEGCTVEALGVICQGIFGLGGETEGEVKIVGDPGAVLSARDFGAGCAGKVCVGGKLLTLDAYEAAKASGARAVVVGGLNYKDIKIIVGREVGVAITGTENVPTSIVVTEGFGAIAMAGATFALAKRYEGRKASANGATQIRAGVIRPEMVIATGVSATADTKEEVPTLELGSPVRMIRSPYFGLLGKVAELPVDLRAMESETLVRVLVADLEDGRRVTVPRANVEMIERR